jgi:SNF2 family DNA or RNA helicase
MYQSSFEKLNTFQQGIVEECITKGSGGVACPVGSGKTFISICVALRQSGDDPILIVVSKSLVSSWTLEIEKFFGNSLKYDIFHPDFKKKEISTWIPEKDTKIVLTTADVMAKYYKEWVVHGKFIEQKFIVGVAIYINFYREPREPFISGNQMGGGFLFGLKWGCLIVDEAQKYTNIETIRCQAIGAVCSPHRWLLSGTLFDEPKPQRILGCYIMLNVPNKPRNLPDIITLLNNPKFKGLNEILVYRKDNAAFIAPKVNDVTISHFLHPEEQKIYLMMKKILSQVNMRANAARLQGQIEELRRFSSYRLVMLMYLRQALLCPLIPIASIAIDASNYEDRSELAKIITSELSTLGIDKWLDDVNSIKSSRVTATLECMNKHKDEKVIVFSTFKSYLDIVVHYLDDSREIFSITATMNTKKRGDVIENFKNSKNGILLLTYQLGGVGLNLQFAATVLLVDFWWNAGVIQQAIGRIFRFGQLADQVNIYFFTSNTGIEEILLHKQSAKQNILEELKTGQQKTKIPRADINQVIRLIENSDLLIQNKQKIKYY